MIRRESLVVREAGLSAGVASERPLQCDVSVSVTNVSPTRPMSVLPRRVRLRPRAEKSKNTADDPAQRDLWSVVIPLNPSSLAERKQGCLIYRS